MMRLGVTFVGVCLAISVLFAFSGPRPGFDPAAVVRQVRAAGRSDHPRAGRARISRRHAERPKRAAPARAGGFDDGEFLVDTSVTLVPGPYDRSSPAVAFDGENFLVVWEDDRGIDWFYDIYGARVTPEGEVIDPAGIAICEATDDQNYPAVAFDGTDFLVVWEDYRSGGYLDIYGARVTPAGEVRDPGGIAISQAGDDQFSAAVGFDGTNFLVVWEDYRHDWEDIYGARVTPQGTVLDPSGLVISQAVYDQYSVDVGRDTANFFVVWEDDRGSSANICGARVTPDGAVLDSAGICVSQSPDDQYTPAVEFGGGAFLVAYEEYRIGDDIFAARVTPEGSVPDTGGIIVSLAANDQYAPAVGFDGTNFLVVWEDGRSVSYGIYGVRVTPQGTVLDSSGFAISQEVNDPYSPAIGFDGANFLVVWSEYGGGSSDDIFGARVTPAGAVLDAQGIAISQAARGQRSPDVVADSENFLVVWEDSRNGTYDDVYGARVTPEGAVLDPEGIAIAVEAYHQSAPAVGSEGTNCLVVWQDCRTGSGWYDIYGTRVTPQGRVLDSGGILISHAMYDQLAPDVSFDGENFLVVWEDVRGAMSWDIYGARVTPQGAVLDTGIAISQADGDQGSPAIGFDDANFIVAWGDFRSGVDWDIYAARVTPAGVVSDTWPVTTQERDQLPLALACTPGGQILTVYQSWTRTVGGRSYNTYRIWGKLGAYDGAKDAPSAKAVAPNPGPTILSMSDVQSLKSKVIFDATGRRVLNPKPGVYFIRDEGRGAGDAGRTRKVVIQR